MPMMPNTWTQPAGEIHKIYGEGTYTKPFAGYCVGGARSDYTGGSLFWLEVDGRPIEVALADLPQSIPPSQPVQAPGTYTEKFEGDFYFEQATSTQHTLTAHAADSCGDGKHYVLESVKVAVVAFR